ncbi:DUF4435 domain-containing protein [Gemella sp. 27098_8_92]|uniref:DUF4435 domain-containing protein n=1 Tax=Gemella sp. 27098_8_92 TaxID=3003687 RepID=UPI00352DF1FD
MELKDFIEKIKKINKNISNIEYSEEGTNPNNFNSKYNEVINDLIKIINEEDSFRERNILEQFISNNYINIDNLYYKGPLFTDEDKIKFEEILENVSEEIERLKYLRIFNESNTIIVGANGSGKSALAAHFKKSDADGIIVIPAQKILFFLQKQDISFSDEENIRNIQKKNFNDKNYEEDYLVSNKVTELSEVFSYHISAIINDLARAGADKIVNNKDSEAKYTKLLEIWKKFYSDIELKYDITKRKLIPKKNAKEYDLNSMSEGEKVSLFYIIVTLFAPKDAYIIIDEPETFLHPSIYNRLWYLLEEYRKDCRFIYISHNLEFISSRNSHSIYWCKKYDGNKDWDLKKISGELEGIPKELVIELLGARKNILFCEGNKESLDYKVYTTLFENEIVVIPVDGHKDVINYTKAFNKSTLFDGNVYGIIDRDYHGEETLKKYEENNVYHLDFNEIEMFLITKEILESVLEVNFSADECYERIQNFQGEVIKEIKTKKNLIINKSIKFLIDENRFTIDNKQLKLLCTDKKDSIYNEEAIKNYFSKLLEEINIDEKINELDNRIDKLVSEENYEEALKVSDLKYLFTDKTKKVFDLDYESFCLTKIQLNKNLRKILRDKYFLELSNKLKVSN